MNVDSVGQAALITEEGLASAASAAPFSQRLQAEVESVNAKLVTAETELRDLAAGKQGNIHHVMLALEDARLSFQLLVQVRNKVVEAYQDLLRMQV